VEAGRSPAAKIFDVMTHVIVAVLAGHTDTVLGFGFSSDGQLLATCGADDTIRFWNTTTWKEIPRFVGQKETVNSLCFSPDGRTFASASVNAVKLWDRATGHEVASLKPDDTVANISFSPDGQTLAAYGWNKTLRLWRAQNDNNKRSLLRGH
jgi:WD40 repeat protein